MLKDYKDNQNKISYEESDVFGNVDAIYNLSNKTINDANSDLDLRYELKMIVNKDYQVENCPLLS